MGFLLRRATRLRQGRVATRPDEPVLSRRTALAVRPGGQAGIRKHGVRLVRAIGIWALLLGAPLAAQQPQPQPQQQEEFVPLSQLPAQDQLPAAPLLVTAYAFVWIVLFVYLTSVARRLSRVQREVERLESDMKRGARG